MLIRIICRKKKSFVIQDAVIPENKLDDFKKTHEVIHVVGEDARMKSLEGTIDLEKLNEANS